jgi:hypothetical protein
MEMKMEAKMEETYMYRRKGIYINICKRENERWKNIKKKDRVGK